MLRPLVALALLALPAVAQSSAASARVRVANVAAAEQDRVVVASVPFSRGALTLPAAQSLCAVEAVEVDAATSQPIEGAPLSGIGSPMLRWPDGSVALLSAQWRMRIAAASSRSFVVRALPVAEGAQFAPTPHRSALPDALPIWTELVDPWGRQLRAELVPDAAAGKDGVVADTGIVRVRRFRSTHRIVDGPDAGKPLLELVAHLVTFDGDRRAELTLVLDNREPRDGALGLVRFSSFRVCIGDPQLRFLPAFARENLLPPPESRDDKVVVQDLLPAAGHYLGDGTAKAFRLHLWLDDDALDHAARDAAVWGPVRLEAFADVDDVRKSGAWGAFGGPAPVFGSDRGDDRRQLLMWLERSRLGPYGGFGDPEDARLGGAPRHGDSLLHNVVRWRSGALLAVAEGMALQHTLRPTGGRAPRAPEATKAYRQGIQAHALEAPHGWARIDYEHVSASLLFDYWWLTNDVFAREELARIGASVRAMLKSPKFRTGRGEGRCLEAGALAAMATGDAALLADLVAHAKGTLAPALRTGSACVLPQPPHPFVLDGRDAFDTTSQMAALLRGLAALHRASGDAELLPTVAAIADAMAGPAWLEGEGPKTIVSASEPGRYSMAASPEDRSGSDRTLIGAFVLAADLVDDAGKKDLWRRRAAFLLDREIQASAALSDQLMASANPWLQVALDRRKQD